MFLKSEVQAKVCLGQDHMYMYERSSLISVYLYRRKYDIVIHIPIYAWQSTCKANREDFCIAPATQKMYELNFFLIIYYLTHEISSSIHNVFVQLDDLSTYAAPTQGPSHNLHIFFLCY